MRKNKTWLTVTLHPTQQLSLTKFIFASKGFSINFDLHMGRPKTLGKQIWPTSLLFKTFYYQDLKWNPLLIRKITSIENYPKIYIRKPFHHLISIFFMDHLVILCEWTEWMKEWRNAIHIVVDVIKMEWRELHINVQKWKTGIFLFIWTFSKFRIFFGGSIILLCFFELKLLQARTNKVGAGEGVLGPIYFRKRLLLQFT